MSRQICLCAGIVASAVLGVVAGAQGAVQLDQQNVVTTPNFDAAVTSTVSRAQTFTVGKDGVLSQIGLQWYTSSGTGPNPTIFVSRVNSSGVPEVTNPIYSATIPMNTIVFNGSGLAGAVPISTFNLGSAAFPVKVGDTLAIGVHRPGASNIDLLWRTDNGNLYVPGEFYTNGTGSWVPYSANNQDAGFNNSVNTMSVFRAIPTVDGEASGDGTNFSVTNGGFDINVQRVPSVVDRRGILEFNVGSIPNGQQIQSATLTLDINAITESNPSYPNAKVYAYSGNGSLAPADALQTSVLVGTAQDTKGLEFLDISLNPALIQGLMSSGYLGLLVVGSDDGHQTGFDTMEGAAAFSTLAPTLSIAYVPEPASAAAVMLLGGLAARRRR